MRRPAIVPAHRPGRTVWHRVPAGVKLLALAVFAVVVVAVRSDGWGAPAALPLGAGVLGLALVGHLHVGSPRRSVAGPLLRLSPVLGVLAGYQVLTGAPVRGLELAVDIAGLVLLAGLVTVTTPTDRLLDAMAAAVTPLRRFPGLREHLHPDRVGLTLALAVRSIDVLWDVAVDARDAARARGRGRDVRALVTPTVIRAVGHARATGDALAARGLVD